MPAWPTPRLLRLISNLDPKQVLDSLVQPHARGRVPRRHGPPAVSRQLPLRLSPRRRDPGLLLALRDVPDRLRAPEADDPGVPRGAAWAAVTKPANSDIYTAADGPLRRDVRAGRGPADPRQATCSSSRAGPSRTRTRSRPPSTGRCGGTSARATAREVGHAGHPLRAGVPRPHRLHALADEHGRPAEDDVLPEVPLAAHREPEAPFPRRRAESVARRPASRISRSRRSTQALRGQPGRRRGPHHRADPGRGRRQPLPSRVPRELRRLCDENDMLFIFDEVQTGIGLTGPMWAFQTLGVVPDMFAFGKKTQVCGFASNDRILEEPENVFNVSSRINSTWGGNLVDMVRCRRFLEIIEEEKPRRERPRRRRVPPRQAPRARRGVPRKDDEHPRARASSSPSTSRTARRAARSSPAGSRSTTSWPCLRRARHPAPPAAHAHEGRGRSSASSACVPR